MDPTNNLRTLVVDDDPTTLALLKALLAKQGLDVTAESDPVRAWSLYEAQPFPLVVLDWMLPGMSGLELCQRIRGAADGERSVIILVTSRETREDLEEALKAGVDDYFVKPIDPTMLGIRVQLAARKVSIRAERLGALHDLKHALDRFNLVALSTSEGLWDASVTDPDNILDNQMWFSPQFKRLLGFDDSEFPNTVLAWFERLHPEDAGRVSEALLGHLHQKKPFTIEYRLRTKQNSYRWYRAFGQAAWTPEGRPVRMAGSLKDITDARVAQMKLATRNFELRTLHRLSQLTLRPAPLDQTCGLLEGEIAAGVGMPVVGIAMCDRGAHSVRFQTVRGLPADRADVPRALHVDDTMGAAMALTPLSSEVEALRVRGTPLFRAFEPFGLTTFVSVPMTVDGRLVGLLVLGDRRPQALESRTMVWITSIAGHLAGLLDRLAMEAAFRDSEERFSQLAAHVNHVLWLSDASLQHAVYVNPAYERVWGRSVGGLQTDFHEFLDAIHPDDRQREIVALSQVDHAPYDAQFRIVRPDGEVRWVRTRAYPIRDAAGKVYRLAGISEDVTLRRDLETQLLHSQKMQSIGQLAAGIAHEINTPTQYVGDNALFLEEAFQGIAKVLDAYRGLETAAAQAGIDGEILQSVRDAVEETDLEYLSGEIPKAIRQSREGLSRVSEIVRAMKEFSHPGKSEKAPVDINDAIKSTSTVCRNEWKYYADMVLDLDPDLPPVPCLSNEMNQVYLNIIVNAAQAISGGIHKDAEHKGTITIRTRLDGDTAEIRIEDSGPGIPPEAQGRIFEPFFTTKEVGKGTGQGLAIAHSVVVDKHGGTLTFETEQGKGTAFIIRLPVAPSYPLDPIPTDPPADEAIQTEVAA